MKRTTKRAGRWVFRTRHASPIEFRKDLWLYPELDCSAMVGDLAEEDGHAQFDAYVTYLQRHHPEWLAADAVPILWMVKGPSFIEFAPCETYLSWKQDFLTHFTWPVDATTGEPLDWFALPVINDRFPKFAKALAWTPSPFQQTCPLASILASRNGIAPNRRKP